jgi:uncharacterized protein
MKFLLVLAVLMVAFWIWRNNRLGRGDDEPRPPRQRKLRPPTVMVACLHCGTHLPQGEAVMGQRGAYCCDEHRQQAEGPVR